MKLNIITITFDHVGTSVPARPINPITNEPIAYVSAAASRMTASVPYIDKPNAINNINNAIISNPVAVDSENLNIKPLAITNANVINVDKSSNAVSVK